MAEILDSRVISLDATSTETDVNIDYDHELNLYGTDGETVTSFYQNETIYLLVQLPPGYSIDKFNISSGGLVLLGEVERTMVVEGMFFPDSEPQSISWYPSSGITVLSDHERPGTPVLTVEDKEIKSNVWPVVVDFSYKFRAYSVRVNHPVGLVIPVDDEHPMGITVETIK